MKNKYLDHSHLCERKFKQVVRLFCEDLPAQTTANITGLSRQTVNKIYGCFRVRIADLCSPPTYPKLGVFELDESYFGARRVRGIRGRGAKGKTIVFGILERGGWVYTQVVDDCSADSLLPVIQEVIAIGSTIYTDNFRTYLRLEQEGYTKHFVVNHGENIFALPNRVHTNGIENFWGVCKTRLTKFKGISRDTFYLHLKECEFRYNNRAKSIYKILLDNFRAFPLKLS